MAVAVETNFERIQRLERGITELRAYIAALEAEQAARIADWDAAEDAAVATAARELASTLSASDVSPAVQALLAEVTESAARVAVRSVRSSLDGHTA